MKRILVAMFLTMTMWSSGLLGQSQQITPNAAATVASTVVPTLVKFSGSLTDVNSKPLNGTVGVTFLLYKDEQGGAPLWMETQNLTLDKTGHYTVVLGSTTSQGLPTDLFASGEARWLAVQAEGQVEQPRVLLLSVPYALKAGDAQTVGGLPASAFVLAAPGGVRIAATSPDNTETANTPTGSSRASSDVTTTGGTVNAIPLFTTATNVQNSLLTQTGAAEVNVAGKLNLPATGVATSAGGKVSQPQAFVASAYNSSTTAAVAQTFQLQAESFSNNTATPSGTLNLLYGSGTTTPAETGLKISSKGLISFAAGQTFPGTGSGTVKSVDSGAGLTGGPITGTGTLSIANVGVTNAMLAHPSLTITPGTALTGGGVVMLGGTTTLNVDTTKIPQLNVANTFTGNQTVKGNLSDTGNITATGSVTAATGAYTANNTSEVVNITQKGTGSGIASVAAGGTGLSGTGNIGVLGTGGPGDSAGVEGTSAAGFGVFATTTSGIAVFATSSAPNGVGSIEGYAGSTATGATTSGVTGYSTTQFGEGVRGLWSNTSTVGANTSQTGVWGDSSVGNGVTGTSDSSVGVYGQSTSFYGVAGISAGATAAGVNGINTSTGFGVLGYANGSAGQGVWGESFATTNTSTAGPDGVHGVTHSAYGSGVAGVNTATNGAGVFGSDTSGYGFSTDSHVNQSRNMGGWVKAMAYIDSSAAVARCFNGQILGSTASTVPCGLTLSFPIAGITVVDFGFKVDDRFVTVSFTGVDDGFNYGLDTDGFSITANQVQVAEPGTTFFIPFYIIVF